MSSEYSRLSLSASSSSVRELRAIERQLRQLLRRLPELLPQPPVVVEQRGSSRIRCWRDDALERRRLLEELAAGAAGLRRLQHCLLALRRQSVERQISSTSA